MYPEDHALLQVAQLHQFSPPKPYDLNFLDDWLERPDLGDDFLQGLEARTWREENAKDLVAVSTRKSDNDLLTTLIADKIFPWIYACFGLGIKVRLYLNILRPITRLISCMSRITP